MLGISFVNFIFITHQKKSFGQKNFAFHARDQRAILPELKNCQNGTFEPMHGIQKKNGRKTSFEALRPVHVLLSRFYPDFIQILSR